MDEKELENKNEQKETLDNADIGKVSVVTKHEIAMALFNFCHNIYIAFGIFILASRVLKFDMSAASGILFKAAYIAFAFLVLLFTACLRGEVKQKGEPLYIRSVLFGILVLAAELGVILFCLR